MQLQEIEKIWEQYKIKYNLFDWTLEFSKRYKRVLGSCNCYYKKIKLNKKYVIENDIVQVKHTLLHEIAHAISPMSEGHGKIWKSNCIKLGIPPMRCHNEEKIIEYAEKQTMKGE